ncbi:hypothetical protein C9994_07510 [Marivirga lumbricoides]|uniref:Uncharacterized protein n=1 Tax=Marivirga lumbricoides TaxID=1046115 RepID=A0A2T4DRL3_9BACT|nr:hypothetical protein C9994_07510 [Marivirga lumbricoides]
MTTALLFVLNLSFGQILDLTPIYNDPNKNSDFANGSKEITQTIRENLNNLNLYEYAHALPELYKLISFGEIKSNMWRNFIDSLEQKVLIHSTDTTSPYFSSENSKIIPLQVQFFLNTVQANEKLKNENPDEYNFIIDNTSSMLNLGYLNMKEIYNDIKISEVKGETNFWYFLQILDCKLIDFISTEDPSLYEKVKIITSNMDITSTYITPFFLQKRKWYALQYRLLNVNSFNCNQIGSNMNHISIKIEDKNKQFFKESLLDGIDEIKIKEF